MKRALFALTIVAAIGCGSEGSTVEHFGSEDTQSIPMRTGSVVVEGCKLDSWQTSQLQSAAARRVLRDVILVCPSMRASGDVAPVDPDARAAVALQLATIRQMGYSARLAVTLSDDFGQPLSSSREDVVFADAQWRANVIAGIAAIAKSSDGIEIDLQKAPSAIRPYLSQFIIDLSNAVRLGGPNVQVGVFVPPSVMSPSDVQGGDAYDLAAIGASVDHVRVMTLDFSCCGAGPGPAIDSGWAVDAVRFAMAQTNAAIDVAVPLYGTDFSGSSERPVTYLEARAIADAVHAGLLRGPNGTLHFTWADAAGQGHETWFDDGVSTARILSAWDASTLPRGVGVVFYGLGAEDPMLWDTISRGMR